MTGPSALRATSLSAGYRGRSAAAVLTDVDLDVAAGSCLAVLGPSGSGKSTLARCLIGLHRPRAGRLEIAAAPTFRPTRRRTLAQRAAIQYIFQDARAAFDPYRPLTDQVIRPAVNLRHESPVEATSRLSEVATRLGIRPGLLDHRVTELSGGELQRAALLRALMARPDVLICDEITTGLDPVSRDQVLHLLEQLMSDGLAVIIITHERYVADRLASATLRLG